MLETVNFHQDSTVHEIVICDFLGLGLGLEQLSLDSKSWPTCSGKVHLCATFLACYALNLILCTHFVFELCVEYCMHLGILNLFY